MPHPWVTDPVGAAHTHMRTTRSLAQALGRTNYLVVGAGQTPTHAPHACLLTYGLACFLACTLPLWLASSRARFNSRFLFSSLALSLSSPQNGAPICFSICGPSRRAQSPPKLTPPHLRTVTMMTCALSKNAGISARERNTCINVAVQK